MKAVITEICRILAFLALLSAMSCSGSGPRGPQPVVTEGLLQATTTDMLGTLRRELGNSAERPLVAFAGVDNNSGWEAGNNGRYIEEVVESELLNSGLMRLVGNRMVTEARLEARIDRVSQLTLPKYRKAFLAQLDEQSVRPRYLMWGVLTSLDDIGGGRADSIHRMTLELINTKTCEVVAKSTKNAKDI